MDDDRASWSEIGQRSVTFDTVGKSQARHQTAVFEALSGRGITEELTKAL